MGGTESSLAVAPDAAPLLSDDMLVAARQMWGDFDENDDGSLDRAEFRAFFRAYSEAKGLVHDGDSEDALFALLACSDEAHDDVVPFENLVFHLREMCIGT